MNDKIKEVVENAYTKVPMYIRHASINKFNYNEVKSIEDIPIITKDEYIANPESTVAVDSSRNHKDNDLLYSTTSGSTGKYLQVIYSREEMNKSLFGLWYYRKKWYNILPTDKFCTFYEVANDLWKQKEYKNIKYQEYRDGIFFDKNNLREENVISIYELLLENQPKWMILQPSIAVILCQCIEKYKLNHIDNLKYIELTGEFLLDSTKKYIKKIMKCDVANQYGTTEANSIAFECREGNLHCFNNNVIVEIIQDGNVVKNGTEGDIFITSLINKTMPFIRYGVGDRGIMKLNHKCKCGNRNPIIKLSSARNNDWIYHLDGSKTNAYIFASAIELLNRRLSGLIRQFQVTQKNYDSFLVKLVISDENFEYQQDVIENVSKLFISCISEEKVYKSEFEFEYYNILLPDDSGKLKYFFSDIKK